MWDWPLGLVPKGLSSGSVPGGQPGKMVAHTWDTVCLCRIRWGLDAWMGLHSWWFNLLCNQELHIARRVLLWPGHKALSCFNNPFCFSHSHPLCPSLSSCLGTICFDFWHKLRVPESIRSYIGEEARMTVSRAVRTSFLVGTVPNSEDLRWSSSSHKAWRALARALLCVRTYL